jgi:hypothetical protein
MITSAPPTRRVRRLAAGLALLGFPAALLVEALVDPSSGGTGPTYLAAATDHPGRLTAAAVALVVSAALTPPAAAAILRLARDRGAALATAGAVFAVLGALAHTAIATVALLVLGLPGGDPAQMVAFVDRMNDRPEVGAVVLPLVLSFGLGVALLAWAAWRAGLVGWWGPALVTAVVVAHTALPEVPAAVELAGLTAIAVVFGWLGVRVLRLPDRAW